MPTRRQFIKTGLIGGVALVALRVVYGPFANPDRPITDDYRFAFLNEAQRTVMSAIAPVILVGALPGDAEGHARVLKDVVRGLDTAISGFTPQVQGEVKQLFDLLTFPPTRRLVAGVASPWSEASTGEIDGFLRRWATSPLDLLQSAHQALRQLVFAAWYGNSDAWQRIGYSGPPALVER
jgi:hypothetical protein